MEASFLGLIIGLGILVAVAKAIHDDCIRRGGSPATAMNWAAGTLALAIIAVPWYLATRPNNTGKRD